MTKMATAALTAAGLTALFILHDIAGPCPAFADDRGCSRLVTPGRIESFYRS